MTVPREGPNPQGEAKSLWQRRQAWIAAGKPEGQEPRLACPVPECVGGRRIVDHEDLGECPHCCGKGYTDGTELGP